MTWGDRSAWADHAARLSDGQPLPLKKLRKKPGEEEHQIQCAFIEWVRIMQKGKWPELELLYAIPLGGHRHPAVAAKLKAEGVKAGIPDLHLPVPRGPWASLYLETKRPGGMQSAAQKEIAWKLMKAGNLVKVCDSVDALIAATEKYLSMSDPKPVQEAA